MRRPLNVLVLMSDEQSWGTLGSTQCAAARTPHLDGLAARGVTFDRCYTPFPLCCPSRASLWTALTPRHHHVLGNWRAIRPGLRHSSFAAAFRDSGYHTLYTGKWHVPGTTPGAMGFVDTAAIPAVIQGRDRGRYIEAYRAYAEEQGYRLVPGHVENVTAGDLAALRKPDEPRRCTAEIRLKHYLETWQTTEFVTAMERRPRDRPWFAVCSYNAPHFPMVVPEPYDRTIDRSAVRLPPSFASGPGTRPSEVRASRFATDFADLAVDDWVEIIAHYLGLVSLVDDQVGRVLAYLDAQGELDRTVVIFTSDHGDMMGAHRLMEKGHLLHYEETLRVPLVIAHPDGTAGRSDHLVSLVDLGPTLLDITGVDWAADHDGKSFAALVADPTGHGGRQFVVSESVLYGMCADATGEYTDPAQWSAASDGLNVSVRSRDLRYTYRSRDEEELYDLAVDTHEQCNVAGSPAYAERLKELRDVAAAEVRDVFPQVGEAVRVTRRGVDEDVHFVNTQANSWSCARPPATGNGYVSAPVTEEQLHPRPQLARSRWTDLTGTWQFAFDDEDRGLCQDWCSAPSGVFDRVIEVPYPPESKLSGIGDRSYHPVVWYRRLFGPLQVSGDERVILHFGAVDYHAQVWVDERYVGEHEGGHTPFSFDVTDVCGSDRAEHSVVVRAVDDPTDTGQPRGKQTWRPEPSGVWYDRTSGIWQPVWLEVVPALHVTDLSWTTDLVGNRVELEITLAGKPVAPATIDVRLTTDSGLLADETVRTEEAAVRCAITIPALGKGQHSHLLWSPESPTLVDADITVRGTGGADHVRSYLGLSTAGFRDGLFLLNERPYYLRMVLEQGFWPHSHLVAPSADALRREVEAVKELGFTGVRIHQKVEDPRFLYWCDRLGLLVWGEMANAQEFSPDTAASFATEWMDVVRRDRSHPCVVTWVPLNESWGVAEIGSSARQQHYATALYHLTKALDPARPVISNDGWEHTESDVWGVHDYAPTGASLRERYGSDEALSQTLYSGGPGRRKVLLTAEHRRGQPVVITEFGGLSYAPLPGEKWFGYGTVESSEEFLETFEDLVTAILDNPRLAGFCYTQLTDTQQETNGLLTEERQPKLPAEAIREIVTRPSSAVPSEVVDAYRRRAKRAGEKPDE